MRPSKVEFKKMMKKDGNQRAYTNFLLVLQTRTKPLTKQYLFCSCIQKQAKQAKIKKQNKQGINEQLTTKRYQIRERIIK